MGRELLLAFLLKPSSLTFLLPLTTTNATPSFSEKMLGIKVREKEKRAMVVYILFKAFSHPLFLSFSHLI